MLGSADPLRGESFRNTERKQQFKRQFVWDDGEGSYDATREYQFNPAGGN